MNRLILIRGPICAGKSITASFLQNILKDCSLVDQDSLKRSIDKTQASEWRSNIAFDTTLYLARLLMERNRDIIADIHSSKPNQYNAYKKLALENDYKLFSFLLYPPLDVCLKRNLVREIPDVQYKITEEDIVKYWKNLFKIDNEFIFDTSTMNVEDIVKKILEIIK